MHKKFRVEYTVHLHEEDSVGLKPLDWMLAHLRDAFYSGTCHSVFEGLKVTNVEDIEWFTGDEDGPEELATEGDEEELLDLLSEYLDPMSQMAPNWASDFEARVRAAIAQEEK